MKFTDGFWTLRPGVDALYAQEAYDIERRDDSIVVSAPTKVITRRGDTLNRPLLTVTLSSPLEGVVRVRVERHTGAPADPGFDLVGAVEGAGTATVDETGGVLRSGPLEARIAPGAPWDLSFAADGRPLTHSGPKSLGFVRLAPGAAVPAEPTGLTGVTGTGLAASPTYLHGQLSLGVGELVYGLGERFGPLVKNGQTVDIWNSDGGTSSDQSYKNVPFYLTNRGYGVLVNHRDHVSFEVGSEAVEQVQFSVAGESLEFMVVYGPTPERVLERYTALTGRPAAVPAWSYGLWLSTSFTTDYDEVTVTSFVDGMRERDIPLSVFHFDCFWMREFNWTDFEWDPRVFPDPEGTLSRLHQRGLRVSAWINPYIAQRSALFAEARDRGYLVRRADGSVWQWDMWQAGMGLVDFTHPEATRWYQEKLRGLLRQGVDAIKTDFGERVPTDVVWHDGSRPGDMHNWYAQLYNRAVFDVLEKERGAGEAVVFARAATAGGQRMPVHWGGDNSSTYESMAETLRAGLSLALSGFAHWSHDVGGFEGMPDPAVFKRWTVFGLLSSHTRLHASTTYRVPWLFDEAEGRDEADPQSAVSVMRRFTRLKIALMPYLFQAGLDATRTGLPVLRPMQLAFPGDPAVEHLDRQYLLGPDLLVAPVFSTDGAVDFYLPPGRWTHLLTGESVEGGGWQREVHAFDSLPLYVRPGAVIPFGPSEERPDVEYTDGLTLRVFPGPDGDSELHVTTPTGREARFLVARRGGTVRIASSDLAEFTARTPGGTTVSTSTGELEIAA
ncbi:alpha-xylosidase [Jiangella endophytica]|uniref:alpha-xylosidase n=1 Tax=Jiangella endophytica TaxID=1623398 RepID=UPI000E34D218|nr:alpha-xylosidase [Jiangella endophytica]